MRTTALVLACTIALAGCARAPFPTSGNARDDAPQPAELDPISATQAELIFPTIALGEALVQAERQLDRIRHEVPRGQPLRTALDEYATQVADLRIAAAQVSNAAQDLETTDPVVREAAAIVEDLLALADEVASAAEAEHGTYVRLADVDVATDTLVAAWERGGTQSELRTVLTSLQTESAELTERAEAIPPAPAACPALRDSRARWASVVGDRSATLAGLLRTATAEQFDVRREEFRSLPYGEDRLAADAADRQCWLDNSPVVGAAGRARTAIEQLRTLFTGRPPG